MQGGEHDVGVGCRVDDVGMKPSVQGGKQGWMQLQPLWWAKLWWFK